MPYVLMMGLWYIVFLFSLVIHEASHAWASMKLGDDTACEGGQVSLDPLPHIKREPVGTVVIPVISYLLNGWMIGWASAPIDPHWALHNPRSSAKVSLAGPLANLSVVFASGIIIRAGVLLGFFSPPGMMNFTSVVAASQQGFAASLAAFLSAMFSLNLLLFVFNILPFPPLDGSGIIPLFLKQEEVAVKYMHFIGNSTFSIIGILIAWRILGLIFDPIHTFFVNALYSGVVVYM